MNYQSNTPPAYLKIRRECLVFLLLSLLISLIYSNTLRVPWQFDDYGNIIGNPHVEMGQLESSHLSGSFLNKHGKFDRPVSRLTFGLNWYLGGTDVTGYHIINILIHISSAFVLYLIITNTLKTPNLEKSYTIENRYFISILAAVLWASNPIQTQAVTYIVQRMASLAGLFYLLGLLFYLKARINRVYTVSICHFTLFLTFFLLAVLSKENSITLPLAVLLMEAIFFQDLRVPETRKRFFSVLLLVVFILLTLTFAFFIRGGIRNILLAFEERPFTLYERLITEPRILLFYLSQIFYPNPLRLSIEHDVAVSRSVFDPWTTLPSLIVTGVLIGFAVYSHRRRPLLAFAILFYFLTHSVESTFLPLELIFEHRNYLPSAFLFVPITAAILRLMERYSDRSIYYILISAVTLLIIGCGTATYLRNMVWVSKESLWKDAVDKAPGRARPYHNLAVEYFKKYGQAEYAINLIEQSLSRKFPRNRETPHAYLTTLGSIYYKRENYEEAFKVYQKAYEIYPEGDPYHYILTMARLGRITEAIDLLKVYSSEVANNDLRYKYLKLLGALQARQEKYVAAMASLKQAIKIESSDNAPITCMAIAASRLGRHRDAKRMAKWAYQIGPDRTIPLFALVDISLSAGDVDSAEDYFNQLMRRITIVHLEAQLGEIEKNLYAPVDKEKLSTFTAIQLSKKSKKFL